MLIFLNILRQGTEEGLGVFPATLDPLLPVLNRCRVNWLFLAFYHGQPDKANQRIALATNDQKWSVNPKGLWFLWTAGWKQAYKSIKDPAAINVEHAFQMSHCHLAAKKHTTVSRTFFLAASHSELLGCYRHTQHTSLPRKRPRCSKWQPATDFSIEVLCQTTPYFRCLCEVLECRLLMIVAYFDIY